MSNNKEDTPNDPNEEISSRQTESNVAREEASREKLDREHRCPICDQVLINACRIGCGHTFCQHCLNLQKVTRNERGKPTCFICDAAVTEICHNNARDKEIDGLYAVLSVDARLSRARAKAERKAEEKEFEEKMKNGDYQPQQAGSNQSTGNGDTCDQAAMNEDGWEEGYPENQDLPDPLLTFYMDEHPYSFWQGNEENEQNEERDFHEHNDYGPETSNDDNLEEADESQSGGPNPLYQQPQQAPIVIRHTVQHIFQTVELQNSPTYHENEDGRHRRGQRHRSCGAENSFSGERSNMPSASTCRRAQPSTSSRSPFFNPNCSGHCYQNPSPTNFSSGYYPYYTARHAVPNYHYPNLPSTSQFLSPMTPLSSFCYRGYQSYPPHPSSHLLYASPSSQAADPYPDFDENRNEFHRVPSSHSWESVSDYHRNVSDELPTSRGSSRDFIHFVEEETDGDQDDDHVILLQEGSSINYESDTQSESDDQSHHGQQITLNLTIPIPDNITVRRRECSHGHRRPSTCSGYIFELE